MQGERKYKTYVCEAEVKLAKASYYRERKI